MQATLYLISQAYVSAGRLARMSGRLLAETSGKAAVVRLEREGAGLWRALDDLAGQGAREITLRPLGLPMSQSLLAWLPGAAGEWLSRAENAGVTLFMAEDAAADEAVLTSIATAKPSRVAIPPDPQGARGKGWDAPPAHRHHILVCTGPRCHLRDAPDLAALLKSEIGRAGLDRDCLVTTTGCLFPCNAGPSLVVYPQGDWFSLPDADAVRAFVQTVLRGGAPLPRYQTFSRKDCHEPV